MLVAYATAAGSTAADNGLYASILAKDITIPGVEVVTMFRNVQLEVQKATNQWPFTTLSGVEEIYLAGPPQVAAPATPPTASPRPVRYKACRLPDFGQVGWLRTEDFAGSTGWVDGGHDQGWGCAEVAGQFINRRAIGPRNKVERLSPSEESRKDILGHVTYKYSCTVRVSWDPLYEERVDPRCGEVATP